MEVGGAGHMVKILHDEVLIRFHVQVGRNPTLEHVQNVGRQQVKKMFYVF